MNSVNQFPVGWWVLTHVEGFYVFLC